MVAERDHAELPRISNLVKKLRSRKYRNSYIATFTKHHLARQMRAFRGERSQSEFGSLVGRKRTQVSRLEDPAYGKWTLQTLLEMANQLDVAVFVRFVDHSTFLRLSDAMDREALVPSSYSQNQGRATSRTERQKHADEGMPPASRIIVRSRGHRFRIT